MEALGHVESKSIEMPKERGASSSSRHAGIVERGPCQELSGKQGSALSFTVCVWSWACHAVLDFEVDFYRVYQ